MADNSSTPVLTIEFLAGELHVCRLPAGSQGINIPPGGSLRAVIQTTDETTIICPAGAAPEGARVEAGWRALKVVGPLDFSLVGILAHLSGVLAAAGISIYALSTFDTDYLLVKTENVAKARKVLSSAGHQVF